MYTGRESSGGKRTFDCKLCDFQAGKKFDMTSHLEDIHHWCYICFSTFEHQDNLRKHIKKNH